MKCPSCAAADLVHDTRDIPYTYKGEPPVLEAVTGDFCPACGEAVLHAEESARVSAAMLDFNKQVNASIADPPASSSACARSSRSISVRPPRFLAATSMPSRATRPARPSRPWRW